MSWANYPDRHLAEKVCTTDELAVLQASSRGYGRRRGSIILCISEETWRSRMTRALTKIEKAKREPAA